MNSGLDRSLTFEHYADHVFLLDTLGLAVERFGIEVHAYSLMPTHYHLLIRTPLANLSRAMGYINGVYTQGFNRRRGREGPLFKGRFKSQLITEERYLHIVLAYLHLNPLRAGLVTRVDADWSWTSHRAYLGLEPGPSWLTSTHLSARFDDPDELDAFVLSLHRGAITWPGEFVLDAGWFAWGESSAVVEDDPGIAQDAEDQSITVAELIRAVLQVTGVNAEELALARRGPGGNPARRFAVWALAESTDLRHRDIATALGMSPAHVATLLSRTRSGNVSHPTQWVREWRMRYPGKVSSVKA